MTTNNEHLKFPSGRTVSAARADAKKRSRLMSTPLSQALDEIVKENGLNSTWAQAMDLLSSKVIKTPSDDIFSCDSVTLLELQKTAKAACKTSGYELSEELVRVCRNNSFNDPELAAKTLYHTVYQKEVHRILAGPMLLTLSATGNDLYINGTRAPEKPTTGGFLGGQVVYGDVTIIEEGLAGAFARKPTVLTPSEGWPVFVPNPPKHSLTPCYS